jgi:hypothetical protein
MNKEFCEICGGEIKISKKGNRYCSNICWKKKKYEKERELLYLKGIQVENTLPNIN